MSAVIIKVFVEGVGEIQLPVNGVSTGSLPMAVSNVDMALVAKTIGPVEMGQDELKWSPVTEVFSGGVTVFHG